MPLAALTLALVLGQSNADLLELMRASQAPDEAALQKKVAETLPKVAKVMGVPVKKVAVKVVSRAEAIQKIQAVLEREYPGDRIERLGAALGLIHLVEPGLDVAKAVREAYGRSVSGFYDPHDRVLYLLDGQPMLVQEMVIPHELAHALQDAKLSLDKVVRERMDSEDAQLALGAAVEGNAQAVAAEVLAGGLVGDEAGIKDLLTDVAAMSASLAMEQGGVAPWLALQVRFPYSGGAALVKALATRADPTALQLLARLPLSTAQVMDPEAYRRDEKPLRGAIDLAGKIEGAERLYATVVGRANLELLGKGLGEGWRGDRLEAARVGGVACAAWVVAFATRDQAERFATAYSPRTGTAVGLRAGNDDGTVSAVSSKGEVVVILEHVPEKQAGAIEAAARKALR